MIPDSCLCPKCLQPFSIQLPSTRHYSRCGLPLMLQCGHACCYQCVVSHRAQCSRSSIISCPLCNVTSNTNLDMIKTNLSSVIHYLQLGLLQWQELEIQLKGENIGFKGENKLFVPSRSPVSLEVTTTHPNNNVRGAISSSLCTSDHFNSPLAYWCADDNVPACLHCRLTIHKGHDVVKIEDRNKDELEVFDKATRQALELVARFKDIGQSIESRKTILEADYNAMSKEDFKQARSRFAELYAILQARERAVQQELFLTLEERCGPLKSLEQSLRNALSDLTYLLDQTKVSRTTASRESIVCWTEQLIQFASYEMVLNSAVTALGSTTFGARLDSIDLDLDKIKEVKILNVFSEVQLPAWEGIQELLARLKTERSELAASEPLVRMPWKSAEKIHSPSFTSPLVSQALTWKTGMELAAEVLHIEGPGIFYIRIENDEAATLVDQLQSQLFRSHDKPRPSSVEELAVGQLVIVRALGESSLWQRGLIEEVNLKCRDVTVFLVDVGRRKLISDVRESVRSGLPELALSIPAQSVRCRLNADPVSCTQFWKGQRVRLQTELIVPGMVGHIGDSPEHTVYVSVVKQQLSDESSNRSTPSWALPLEISAEVWNPYKGLTEENHIAEASNPSLDKQVVPACIDKPYTFVLPFSASHGQENKYRAGPAVLAHLISPGHFYLRLSDDVEQTHPSVPVVSKFSHLSSVLAAQYQVPGTFQYEPESLTVGLVCAVQLDSGDWRRGMIQELTTTTCNGIMANAKLIDVGSVVSLPVQRFFKLDPRWSVSSVPPMALRCSLWGIRPSGHMTKWSGNAGDFLLDWAATAKGLYFRVYHNETGMDEGGKEEEVRVIRLYCEYVQQGGPLESDEIKTVCVNDSLLDLGVAFKMHSSQAPVSVHPATEEPGWSWPASLTLPPDLEAKVIWVDDEGRLYIHHFKGPSNQLDTIGKLLAWYYTGSQADASELAHWEVGEPCIARYSRDGLWHRGVILRADDSQKLASVLFIDYGDEEDKVKYANLRRRLICFDYPSQANLVRLARYPGPTIPPNPAELDMIFELLVDKVVRLSLKYPSGSDDIPVASITHLLENGPKDFNDTLIHLRPEVAAEQVIRPATSVVEVPSIPTDEEIDALDSVDSGDDIPPSFHFEDPDVEMEKYKRLQVPAKAFLPFRILRLLDRMRAVIQPYRHGSPENEWGVPESWYYQADSFPRLQEELQHSAPLFPEMDNVVDHGSPCACYLASETQWYRGLVVGYADDDLGLVRIELVDLGLMVTVSSCHVKLLPMEYLALPRHSAVVRLVNYDLVDSPDVRLVKCYMADGTPLYAFFKSSKEAVPEMILYAKDKRGKLLPALELEI